MKVILLPILLFLSLHAAAQRNADAIVGKWLKVPKKDMVIEVFRENDEFRGKITWTKVEDARKPHGFLIMDRLQYNAAKHTWENGRIHDPSGSTYSATAKLDAGGKLSVHGYKGLRMLGKTKYFEKVE
jgi:uncharacterized protein (DUF2147 family)